MALRINNNIAAINARRRMGSNFRDLNVRLERLSSGLRINRAADDAAGLSVREGMRAELSGMRQNVLNAEQGSNLLQVAEGSLNEISAMLIRMRELAVQSASSTVNDLNRESIQSEYTQIIQEMMALRINNNIAAINARRRMGSNFRDLNVRLERLSSGLRINRAADDAAGLSTTLYRSGSSGCGVRAALHYYTIPTLHQKGRARSGACLFALVEKATRFTSTSYRWRPLSRQARYRAAFLSRLLRR